MNSHLIKPLGPNPHFCPPHTPTTYRSPQSHLFRPFSQESRPKISHKIFPHRNLIYGIMFSNGQADPSAAPGTAPANFQTPISIPQVPDPWCQPPFHSRNTPKNFEKARRKFPMRFFRNEFSFHKTPWAKSSFLPPLTPTTYRSPQSHLFRPFPQESRPKIFHKIFPH